jgi:hypothetical protein
MQREKLYNLHKTAYFIVALFVFKMNKILSDQISTVRKRHFLVQDEFIFSYFIFLSPDILHLKKTKCITRCSVKSSTILKVKLILIVYFLSKKTKFYAINFRCPEKIMRREIPFFLFHI